MVSIQFGIVGINIISKATLNQGMSQFVLVVYRHVVATLVLVPFEMFRKGTCKILQFCMLNTATVHIEHRC